MNIKYQLLIDNTTIHLHKAREKHSNFAKDKYQALSILMEEVGEIAKAINDNEKKDFIESEIYDTIAVLIRMLTELKYE